MYISYVNILCMYPMYISYVYILCIYPMYVSYVYILCKYPMYVSYVCILCMYPMYISYVYILCIYPMYEKFEYLTLTLFDSQRTGVHMFIRTPNQLSCSVGVRQSSSTVPSSFLLTFSFPLFFLLTFSSVYNLFALLGRKALSLSL